MSFGESAILNDGRVVRTKWVPRADAPGLTPGRGLFIDNVFLDTPPLLLPDACITDDGRVWISGNSHDSTGAIVVRDDGFVKVVGFAYGSRTIIKAAGNDVLVAFTSPRDGEPATDGASHSRCVRVTAAGDVSTLSVTEIDDVNGQIDTPGGQGMRDWFGDVPRPMEPLDAALGPYQVRGAITYGRVTIGAMLGNLPGQLVVERDGQFGSLFPGGGNVFRLSANGKYWCSDRYVGEVNASGEIPDVLPAVLKAIIDRINHLCTVVIFKDPEGRFPAHQEVVTNQNQQLTSRACWAPLDSLAQVKGPLIGIYTEQRGGFDDVLAEAIKRNVRIAFDWDDVGVPVLPAGLRPFDLVLVECYRFKPETLDQALTRWKVNLAAVLQQHPGDIALVLQDYDMGGIPNPGPGEPGEVWTPEETVDIIAAGASLLNVSPRISSVWLFEYLRANGMSAHPELLAIGQQVFDASPGPATFQPITGVPPMQGSVTIIDFVDSVVVGQPARAVGSCTGDVKFFQWRGRRVGDVNWLVFATNPISDTDNSFIFASAGDWEIALRGLDSTGQFILGAETGKQRVVHVAATPTSDASAARQALITDIKGKLDQLAALS